MQDLGSVTPVGSPLQARTPRPARARAILAGRGPYLGLLGIALLLAAWYLTVDVLALPRFNPLPGLTQVFGESDQSPPGLRHIAVHSQLLR